MQKKHSRWHFTKVKCQRLFLVRGGFCPSLFFILPMYDELSQNPTYRAGHSLITYGTEGRVIYVDPNRNYSVKRPSYLFKEKQVEQLVVTVNPN